MLAFQCPGCLARVTTEGDRRNWLLAEESATTVQKSRDAGPGGTAVAVERRCSTLPNTGSDLHGA